LVYGALTIFTVSLYLFSVQIIQILVARFFVIQEAAISAVGALAAAAAFHPARKRIQEFVDKSFYRQSYDYRKTILSFNDKAQRIIKPGHLVDFFLAKVNKALPLKYINIFIYSAASENPELFIKRGEEKNIGDLASVCLKSRHILARKRALRTEENVDFSKEDLLEEKSVELIIPLFFKSTEFCGFLAIGRKMSGHRFTRDDLELLRTMAGEMVLNLERIKLQEDVIYERAEKEKLDELNRLKTEFISTVSHELRTPLSSIQGITEILYGGKIKDKAKQDELLRLITGESIRLSRLLHNILDFGKIEQEMKTYNFQKTEIKSVIEEVVKLFQHRLEKDGFFLRTFLPKNPLFLEIDVDAVRQALTNLLDNAIKYSLEKREIDVELIEMEGEVEIQVRDKGIGIPLKDQKKIFEKFYRHPEASRHKPKGVGLGLKIVKHIMEAHKGEIRVESQPNKGSTFSLIFPKP
jgi:two-component system phosphate regulon sensor histidine kinase PhoR